MSPLAIVLVSVLVSALVFVDSCVYWLHHFEGHSDSALNAIGCAFFWMFVPPLWVCFRIAAVIAHHDNRRIRRAHRGAALAEAKAREAWADNERLKAVLKEYQ